VRTPQEVDDDARPANTVVRFHTSLAAWPFNVSDEFASPFGVNQGMSRPVAFVAPSTLRWIPSNRVLRSRCLVVLGLSFLLGCGGASARPTVLANQAATFAHVAAPCLSGETLEHVFSIRNVTGQTLRLPSEGAFHQSCGCTTADVAAEEWEPEKDNQVTLSIKTDGKRGVIRERATVHWQADDGRSFPMEFSLQSEVNAAIDIVPPALVIRGTDPAAAQSVAIQFRSPLAVDWSTLQSVGSSELFGFTTTGVAGDGVTGEVRLLRPISELQKTYETAMLRFQVQVSASSPRLAGQTLLVTLPCSAYLRVPVAVTPSTVVAQWDSERRLTAGRFLLRGDVVPDLVAQGFALESDAGEISHRFVQTGKTQMIVSFDLKPTSKPAQETCVLRVVALDPQVVICEVPGLIRSRGE